MALATAHDGGNYYRAAEADVAGLPLDAAEKLRDLRQAAADAHAIVMAATQQLREAQAERAHAEFERQLSFQRDPKSDKRVQELADVRLARAREKIERAQILVGEREARWNTLAHLVARLDEWLRKVPDELDVVPYPPARLPTPKKGERPQDTADKARKDIARLTADLRRVSSAPIPSTVAKIKARAAGWGAC